MNDAPAGIPVAAPWSLFAGALGRGCVVGAIVLFLLAAVAMVRPGRFEKAGVAAFVLGCLSLFTAFGALALLFVKDQFQYAYVWQHSGTETSLPYKIASVWTAQEGSFLLWAVCSAVFSLLALRGTGPYRRGFVGVNAAFLAVLGGILARETPFKVMKEVVFHGKTYVPPTGNGMVPSLQNYWVIIHPPTIFLGFGCLAVLAAYAFAAMLHRDATGWIPRVRPWALVNTAILGLGISMGGLWAYETQGWGGFWAWDPVENVSFVPWLFVVTFVHGIIVQTARGKWTGTNLFLGGMPFLLFVYGTYLTRSGLLDGISNHSFAKMDEGARGILLWFFLATVATFAGALFFRGRPLARLAQAQADEPGASRENVYRYGMLFLGLLAIVIALGMSWPIVTVKLLHYDKGSAVEEHLYHLVVVWFFLPLMALMAVGPFVSWRTMAGSVLRERLFGVLCVSIGLTGLIHLALLSTPFGVHPEAGATVAAPFGLRAPLALWMLVLLFSVVFVIVANVWRVTEIVRRSAMGIGGFVAHLGLAVLLGGLILSRGYERKEAITVRQGSPVTALGYTVAYKGIEGKSLVDRDRKVEFDVTTPQGGHFVARPGHYQYGDPAEPKDQIWPHIERFATHDVYLSVAPAVVFATEKPLDLKPGESRDIGGAIVEFVASTRKGEFGAEGTEFGAQVRLTETGEDGERHQYAANPTLQLSQGQLVPSLVDIGPNFKVAMTRMDAATKGVEIALLFSPPLYPIEIYEKPFTGLVWLGTGILTLGGAMAAFSRRRVVARQRRTAPSPRSDAPLPAPQS